jgi:hypothetical protein
LGSERSARSEEGVQSEVSNEGILWYKLFKFLQRRVKRTDAQVKSGAEQHLSLHDRSSP